MNRRGATIQPCAACGHAKAHHKGTDSRRQPKHGRTPCGFPACACPVYAKKGVPPAGRANPQKPQ